MGCDVYFYRLKRDILTAKFIEVDKEDFDNYLKKINSIEGSTYCSTEASIIIKKIETDTFLLTFNELDRIKSYIYELSVGLEKWGFNPEDSRFIDKMREFGFELIHHISHGCASLFLLSLGDSESVDYSSWNYDDRDRMNLKKEEFIQELDYIILLHSRIQLNECDDVNEKKELIITIKSLEKNELLKNTVESHFGNAMANERLINESSSILFNAIKLIENAKSIDDDIVIFYS